MTETGCIATNAHVPGGQVPGSAGQSFGLEIRIMDSAGKSAETGSDGEIVVRGPAVFPGYFDDPEATRAAFHDGWFRTGDVGRLDQDGNLFVTGRLKEMINRGGEKVAPSKVDAAIASHPAVLEAAAFAVPHPTLGEDVACAVVLSTSTESPLSVGELRRFAAERLARFKVPSRIYFVDEIPRGELGKPQR
jgi:oxalate---CoA ligase